MSESVSDSGDGSGQEEDPVGGYTQEWLEHYGIIRLKRDLDY